MFTAYAFWVLMAFDTSTHQMHSQQFVSESACQEGKAFLETMRGTYVQAKCIRDQAIRGAAVQPKPEPQLKP